MSCQIKSIANLTNTSNIKEVLFPESTTGLENIPKNELPLQECCISLSSAGDLLAMAHNTQMIILISRWDSQELEETKNKFHMIWYGEVAKEPNEWITSLICLPLYSLGKASNGTNPDWCCILVGFNTGFVRFYTETGALLLAEQLHNEPVVGIKCQSLCSPKHSADTGLSEEVHIIYSSVVCVLQGFPLFSTLRVCRNHLARVQANCEEHAPATHLSYKKWGYKSQDIVNDSEVIGITSVNSFDHLMTASICGGYNASYRSSAPQHHLVIATGKRPFTGFHYVLEGANAPVFSDVAIAVASKLANAIGTAVPWFRGSSMNQSLIDSARTGNQEPVESMTCRFGLSDITREGYNIVTTPNKMLSVIVDGMGRVILIDNRRGIATRMWKGYRDAQCGWIEVEEEKHSKLPKTSSKSKQVGQLRTAMFLVIYAPKKGVIDIWGIQQGPKITTFTASKNGRLLYINYGLMGMNDNAHLSRNKPQYSCVFMDPLGGLKEITVPFHFALNSKNVKRARDIHVLKKLKTFLREEDYDEEKLVAEICNACMELKTNEIRMQMVEMLMTNKNIVPDGLLAATTSFLAKVQEYGRYMKNDIPLNFTEAEGRQTKANLNCADEDEMEPAAKTLHLLSTQLQQGIKFYNYVRREFDTPPDYDTITASNDLDSKTLSLILLTSEREVHRVQKLSSTVNNYRCANVKSESKVKFKDDGRMFLDFLSSFEFGVAGPIKARSDLKVEKRNQISQLLFQGWMYSKGSIDTWKEAALNSNIDPSVLMKFALIYWLDRQKGVCLGHELKHLTQLLLAICSIANIEEICVSDNELSLWWKNVRTILSDANNPLHALTGALACRSVLMTMERQKEKSYNETHDDNGNKTVDSENGNTVEKPEKSDEKINALRSDEESISSINEWENVSKDSCQFTLLIGNLEDVTILNAVVGQQPQIDDTTEFFALPYVKCDISLSLILSKGKGSVSEIVAKWLSSAGLEPSRLIDTTDVEFDQIELASDPVKPENLDESGNVDVPEQDQAHLLSLSVEVGSEAKSDTTGRTSVLEQITLLKRHFPYSLTSSVLLANLCWEFAMHWNKDITQLEALDAALVVLRQIPMKHLRHGVCCLLWSVHIKKRLEACAKLINKLGKLPKERLCMQDIGLSDIQLTTFLQHSVSFLEIFIDSEILEPGQNAIIKSEELWEGYPPGPQPFATLAVTQTPAWYDLVMLHVQLANVLYMIASLNIKISKPLNNLFESVAQPYFFQNISDNVMLTWYRDDNRDNLRTDFLCRVITASMDSIHRETTDGKTLNSMQAIQWMSRCQALASIWKINNDKLRMHQVCQLYINGFDRLAEEVVTAVSDLEKLSADLLPIAGRRMMGYLSKTPDLLEEVSRINPALTKYLESLTDQEVLCADCSNEDTVELIHRISRHLPESHYSYHLAQLMLDATFIYSDNSGRVKSEGPDDCELCR